MPSVGVAGHIIKAHRTYRGRVALDDGSQEPGETVLLKRTVGWGAKPADRILVPVEIIRPTPEHGDSYLVRHEDGRLDIIGANQIEQL